MVTKIELWRTDDGKDFNTEVEALRHENTQLKTQVDQLNWQIKCQPLPIMKVPLHGDKPYGVSGYIGDYTVPSGTHFCETFRL